MIVVDSRRSYTLRAGQLRRQYAAWLGSRDQWHGQLGAGADVRVKPATSVRSRRPGGPEGGAWMTDALRTWPAMMADRDIGGSPWDSPLDTIHNERPLFQRAPPIVPILEQVLVDSSCVISFIGGVTEVTLPGGSCRSMIRIVVSC
jgi:hypothetical protein